MTGQWTDLQPTDPTARAMLAGVPVIESPSLRFDEAYRMRGCIITGEAAHLEWELELHWERRAALSWLEHLIDGTYDELGLTHRRDLPF